MNKTQLITQLREDLSNKNILVSLDVFPKMVPQCCGQPARLKQPTPYVARDMNDRAEVRALNAAYQESKLWEGCVEFKA